MKKILVALDGSPRHHGVLHAAAELAAATGAELVLFRAVTVPSDVPVDAYTMAPADFARTLEEHARAALEVAAREIGADKVLRVHVEAGTPWDAICRAAREDDVDLIVLGSHGYDVLDRFLGTTAAKVVNHADRSVLVVRAPERVTSK
ncbi:MAG: universal stress protein [Labilithrix sp.]|nr:universal stress protein [Labilithrix sp.]MCW5812587.1 universal stress protein [Labilithrix sp.]